MNCYVKYWVLLYLTLLASLLSEDFCNTRSSFLYDSEVPVAWYFLHEWLQKYEYWDWEITWWIFRCYRYGLTAYHLNNCELQAIKAA